MYHKLAKDITLKSGIVLAKGTPCEVAPIKDNTSLCEVTISGQTHKLRYTSVFKAPSVTTMMRWDNDHGGCKTPAGKMVEQDGWDEHGFPAWTKIVLPF